MTRHLPPITGWLPRYRAAWLVPDALAGLTVWALVVPESMAYASIAGVPVQYGLYSVPLAIVDDAIFGSSRRLFVGPSSTVAGAATEAGSKSPVSFLVVAALVVLTVLFIAGVFEQLPEAVLGAIVIHAVSGMIAVRKVTRLWKASVPDFWLAIGALAGVVTVGILAGIVVGVVLSLVLLLHRLAHPHAAILGRLDAEDRFADVATHADARSVPGSSSTTSKHRSSSPMQKSWPDDLRTRLAAADPSVHTVVFDFEAVYEIDTEGADTLVHLGDVRLQRHREPRRRCPRTPSSPSVNPSEALRVAVRVVAACCVRLVAGFLSAIAKHLTFGGRAPWPAGGTDNVAEGDR